eukprot:4907801-Amphidinium_carterae.1
MRCLPLEIQHEDLPYKSIELCKVITLIASFTFVRCVFRFHLFPFVLFLVRTCSMGCTEPNQDDRACGVKFAKVEHHVLRAPSNSKQ